MTSPKAHLAMMDRVGIGTAMLSITSPGVTFGADPVEWARRVNETGARTVRDHPGRFGLLATLPLPYVDAALGGEEHGRAGPAVRRARAPRDPPPHGRGALPRLEGA